MIILVIDESKKEISAIELLLNSCDEYKVYSTNTFKKGIEFIKNTKTDLILSYYYMRDMSGLEFMDEVEEMPDEIKPKVIFFSDYADKTDIIESFRHGILDFMMMPLDTRYLLKKIQVLEKGVSKEYEQLQPKELKIQSKDEICAESIIEITGIGKAGFFSREMRNIRDQALQLHNHNKAAVLIQGDTGTGKEIIARLIHFGVDNNSEKLPFISLNCSAISSNLFESELFGYEGGAFTGADPKGRKGKLELAANGTIFLDEIADMPSEFQPKLLRVLQERSFYRISGNKEIPFNARVICATNYNLLELVETGKFRRDLYYRLNTANLHLLPLCERQDDIVPLAMMHISNLRAEGSQKFSVITEGAKELLKKLPWKGNIRELNTTIERIFFKYNDTYLQSAYIESVVDEYIENRKKIFYYEFPENEIKLDDIFKLFVKKVLKLNENNITKTAKYLGTTRNRIKRIAEI